MKYIILSAVYGDDVTKMIFLKLFFFPMVQNNLSEKCSHAKKWLFSAINSGDMGV